MAFFSNADEVYEYVGGVFRVAADHPEIGPKMAAANVTLQIYYSDPESKLLIRFRSRSSRSRTMARTPLLT